MHVKTHYAVGVVLYPNDLQCLQKFTVYYIAIHHLLTSVNKIYLKPITSLIYFHSRIAGEKYVNFGAHLVNEYVFTIINGQHFEDGESY